MVNEKGTILSNDCMEANFFRMRIETETIAKAVHPGQFLQIKCSEDNFILRKPISVFDRGKNYVEILYEVVGEGTKALSKRISGTEIEFIGPLGNGFSLPSKAVDSIVLVSGGIGFAPLHFLAKEIAGLERFSTDKLHFFCGMRDQQTCFLSELLHNIPLKSSISTDDGSIGFKGRVTELLDNYFTELSLSENIMMYSCGPKPMLKAVQTVAEKFEIKCELAYHNYMICGIGACLCCVNKASDGKYKRVCYDGPVFDAKELVI